MEDIFTKDFVKFLFGFTAIVTAALLLVFIMQTSVESDTQRADTTQTLPATTTGQ